MAQQERAIRTRQKILVVAAGMFDEVGYEATKITDILERAGLTKGALYFHFSSKEELAQAVLAAQVDALPPIPPQELKLQEALDTAQLLTCLLQRKTGDPIIQGSVRLTVDQGSSKDGLDRRVPMRAWIDYNRHFFGEARLNGELLPHVDVESLSWTFTGAFTGVQVLSSIMTDREDMPERISALYRGLMPSIAVPAVLARLDFSPERGVAVYEESMKLREQRSAASAE
ncbi:ScbR family autoregulator-binding transcription factor [Streptomyces sp. NPDC004609]|uniref:ScbR family autoregulator-binding transcription factor n=1 Tax=Streptomyces sp. NPDC004609 TaxID=3364704 RepID=UPI00367C561D